MNIQDGTTSTSVAQFSLFFYSVHSPFLILHYQAQLRQFYTPHESLNTLDAYPFERIFDCKDVSEDKKVKLVSLKLRKYASLFVD